MVKRAVTVCRKEDLEARPIAMLVQLASQFSSTVHIELGEKKINAKSIMGMMSLSVCNGDEVVVVADGDDEESAVNAIEGYLRQ